MCGHAGWVAQPMERSDGCRDAGEVPRLLVFWSRPHHISRGEVDAWLHSEIGRLLRLDAVERADISRLERASDRHDLPCDWILELHLARGASVAACVESPDGGTDSATCGCSACDPR
jgi:hypothetical protein